MIESGMGWGGRRRQMIREIRVNFNNQQPIQIQLKYVPAPELDGGFETPCPCPLDPPRCCTVLVPHTVPGDRAAVACDGGDRAPLF